MAHWVLAQFTESEAMTRAASRLITEGYPEVETFSPYAVPAALELLPGKDRVALPTLVGGLCGIAIGGLIQWFCNAHDFPIDVGGRPLASVPMWIPICFETAVLLGSFTALYSFFVACRLPRLDDPLQDVTSLGRATRDRFLLGVHWALDSPSDPLMRRLLELGAVEVEASPP
jgi:hypothetical protein